MTLSSKKLTVRDLRRMKEEARPISVITAYDAVFAGLAADAGVDLILVGDSVATTELGYGNTLPVTMEDMIHHAGCVRRGAPGAFIIGDMPFMSYQSGEDLALVNAGRFLKEAGCDAVKIEGGADFAPLIARMVRAGIPVMAHVGLLPQHVLTAGGVRKTGKTPSEAEHILADALAVEEAGAFAVVLECMNDEAAAAVTAALRIPTIGIGAGHATDGQVQVLHDVLGLTAMPPRHAKPFADLRAIVGEAFAGYVAAVRARR